MGRIHTVVWNWDVFPKVVPEGKESLITIKPIGRQSAFPQKELFVQVLGLQETSYAFDDTPKNKADFLIAPDADGCLRVRYTFRGEQEYFIRVFQEKNGEGICQQSVYCLKEDLYGLIPLMGDQHIHTMRSDGGYDPALVAGMFRRQGYDYIAITDHNNIIGSLEAIDAFQDVPIDLNMMPGEEVHMPKSTIHVVNFGCRRSVNAMAQQNVNKMLEKNDPAVMEKHKETWSKQENSDFPGTMPDDEFIQMIQDYAATLDIPQGIPRYEYGLFKWVCNEIRKSGGIAIFAHPYWIANLYHVDERLTQYIFEQHDFDAYEVLGGENYFEQNGHQTVQYYEQVNRGLNIPIVGSSDTHPIYENRNLAVAATIVFAKANTQQAIHEAILGNKAVAVDFISKEPRLVGSYRLVKYAQFLMNDYFHKHKLLCEQEGVAMQEYACGEREEGKRMLEAAHGRVEHMWHKYFGV